METFQMSIIEYSFFLNCILWPQMVCFSLLPHPSHSWLPHDTSVLTAGQTSLKKEITFLSWLGVARGERENKNS